MFDSERDTALVAPPVARRRRQHVLVAALLAVLGTGAVYRGLGWSLASAAPQPAPLSPAATPRIEQSLQPHEANADVDVGPGQMEPVLVSSP